MVKWPSPSVGPVVEFGPTSDGAEASGWAAEGAKPELGSCLGSWPKTSGLEVVSPVEPF